MTILSISSLQTLMDVSFHKRTETMTASIEAVENAYVKKYFKDAVFVYVSKNVNASPTNNFVDFILDGGYYDDANSPINEYHFNGLNKAIALLAYCDLLINQTVVTRYGATNKNDSYSVKPDFSSILEQISRYRKTAISYLEDIDFMLRNIDMTLESAEVQLLLTNYRLGCVGKMEGILNEWI